MENVTKPNNTETAEKNKENDITINDKAQEITIKSPIFLLFAEYIGYVSNVIEWVEDYLNGKPIPKFYLKVINEDALCLAKQIKKKYTREEIMSWYQSFYDVILADYEKKLEKVEKK